MAPLELPPSGAALQSFEPQRVDFLSPSAGGRVDAITAGNPLWLAVWQLGKIGQAKSDAWRAAMLRQRGSQRRFYGRDLSRPLPLLHLGGLPAGVSGAASGWSQAINADGDALLTVADLPGITLSIGDYVDFRWTTAGEERRALVRVVVGGSANGSGAVTAMVEPPVPTLVVPGGAVAHIDDPACIMRLVPGEWELGPIDRRLAVTSGKVTGVQDLRP